MRRWGLILALSVIIFLSAFFSYRNLSGGCRATISRYLKDSRPSSSDQISLIYLIKSVHLCCRPCYDYERYNKDDQLDVIFYVDADFSDADIENFRTAFQINPNHKVARKDKAIKDICRVCEKKNENSNFLLIINEKGDLFDLKRF